MQIHCKGPGDCHKPIRNGPRGQAIKEISDHSSKPTTIIKMTATPHWKRALSLALAREPLPGSCLRKTGGVNTVAG